MIECGSLEYAQARIQARHGERTRETTWQRLETIREFAPLLDAARNSPLRPWLVGIGAPGRSEQIEPVLRRHWREVVAEVARWMPPAWQPSLGWCAVWPELPVFAHLARGGEAWPWMSDDPDWRAVCDAPAAARPVLIAGGALGPLATAWAAPDSLSQAWAAEWRRRLPHPPADGDSLSRVAGTLLTHAGDFAAAPAGTGAPLRRALQSRLAALLRRAALEPATAFIHLALCALDFERLRGELLGRALFPHRAPA